MVVIEQTRGYFIAIFGAIAVLILCYNRNSKKFCIEYFLKSRNIKEFEIIKSLFFLSLLFFSWIIPYNMPGYKYVNCLTVLSLYQIGHLLKKYMIKIKKLYFMVD